MLLGWFSHNKLCKRHHSGKSGLPDRHREKRLKSNLFSNYTLNFSYGNHLSDYLKLNLYFYFENIKGIACWGTDNNTFFVFVFHSARIGLAMTRSIKENGAQTVWAPVTFSELAMPCTRVRWLVRGDVTSVYDLVFKELSFLPWGSKGVLISILVHN
jgi:hypothetical protein